jgi:hypothetical protein
MLAKVLALFLLTLPMAVTPLIAGEDIVADETEGSTGFPPPADIDGATPWYFDNETGEWVYLTIIDDSNLIGDDRLPPDVDLPDDSNLIGDDRLPPDVDPPDEEVDFTKGDDEGCDGCEVFTVSTPGGEGTESDDIEVRSQSFFPEVTAADEDPASDVLSDDGFVAASSDPVDPALLEELRSRVEAELLRRGSGG